MNILYRIALFFGVVHGCFDTVVHQDWLLFYSLFAPISYLVYRINQRLSLGLFVLLSIIHFATEDVHTFDICSWDFIPHSVCLFFCIFVKDNRGILLTYFSKTSQKMIPLLIVVNSLELYDGFILYFGYWHSIIHLYKLYTYFVLYPELMIIRGFTTLILVSILHRYLHNHIYHFILPHIFLNLSLFYSGLQ